MPTAFYWPEKGQQQQKREQPQLRLFRSVVVVRGSTYFLLIEKLIKGDKNYTCHRFSRCRRSPATAAAQQWQQWTRPEKTRFNYTHTHLHSLSLSLCLCVPLTPASCGAVNVRIICSQEHIEIDIIYSTDLAFLSISRTGYLGAFTTSCRRVYPSLSLSPSFVQSNVAREGESAHQRVGGIECKCERDSARAQQGKLIKSSCINHGTYLVSLSLSLSLLRSFARIYPLTARRSRRRCCRRRRRRRQSQSLRLRDSDGKLIPW